MSPRKSDKDSRHEVPVQHRGKKESDSPKGGGKTVYVEIDEEVTSVIDRLKRVRSSEVYVVIPKRAMMLQSVVNLKLLKKAAESKDKTLVVVTNDKKGTSLASQIGLQVVQDLRDLGLGAGAASGAIATKAVLDKSKFQKPSLKIGRFSIKDLVGGSASAKGTKKGSKGSVSGKGGRGSEMGVESFMMMGPNKKILGLFVAISILILVMIGYFVLPKAVIALQMEAQVQNPIERIVLADATTNEAELKITNDNVIATNPIETEIELTQTYRSTGVSSTGTNARGIITIYNDSGSTQPLVKSTRFRSPDGLIFRIQSDAIVPAHSTKDAEVVADVVDEIGQVIGERGNIAPTTFTLPALTGTNKTLVYGKSTAAFTGGTTQAVAVVSEQDLTAAQEDIVTQLRNSATSKLIERIMNENKANNRNYYLLTAEEALQIDVVEVRVLGDVTPGLTLNEFQVYGKIRVQGVTYDRNEVIEILDRKIREVMHPDMRLAAVDEDSLTLQWIEVDERADKIKVNASMNYKLEYELSESLVAKIKSHVIGKDVQEATEYLQSLEEVGEAEVDTWPFWVNTIPGVTSNIDVVIDETK